MSGPLLPAALAFIMFALGLGLVPADFARVAARPRAVAVGLAAQVLAVPALAWAIAAGAGLPGAMAAGLVLLAACPGGVSSGLVTRLAGGDTALSISLTAITSLLALLSVPLVVDAALRQFTGSGVALGLPVLDIVRGVFVLTTLPVAAGMLLRHFRPALAGRLDAPARRASTAIFLVIVVATFVDQRAVITAHLGAVGPAALALNLAVMAAGWGGAALAGLARRNRIAIAVECGLQNVALALYLAGHVLGTPALAVPGVIYALLMNLSAIALILLSRRRVLRPQPA